MPSLHPIFLARPADLSRWADHIDTYDAMTEQCDQYSIWITNNITDPAASSDMGNAVRWMRCNWLLIEKYINYQQPHPGLAYSEVIQKLAGQIGLGIVDIDLLMANWIMESSKTPFGRILKKKVAKELVKRWTLLTAEARDIIVRISTINGDQAMKGEWHYKYMNLAISKTAQQVDSAEASTNAVPPSIPSGSPR